MSLLDRINDAIPVPVLLAIVVILACVVTISLGTFFGTYGTQTECPPVERLIVVQNRAGETIEEFHGTADELSASKSDIDGVTTVKVHTAEGTRLFPEATYTITEVIPYAQGWRYDD